MAHRNEIEEVAKSLSITGARPVGDVIHAWGFYKERHTAQVAAQRVLNELADCRVLEKQGDRGSR